METLTSATSWLNGIVWGTPMLILILGTGLFLMMTLKFMPIQKLGLGFSLLFKGRQPGTGAKGDITPFNALMTSLSATIGTGNIAGVATAVFIGGPGALFYMWLTALVGMATKYAEAVCAVKYREKDENGRYVGGPMYYIKNGLGPKWQWLALAFAIFGAIAGFGIGNTVQANSIASAASGTFGINSTVTGIIVMVLVALVLLGGLKRIANVAGTLVPLMAATYLIAGVIVLGLHLDDIPDAFALIFESAFTGQAAAGGFAGATVWAAIRFGVARGIFSNEAGLGSAPIAHASANTKGPVNQGLIAMLGTFIDTLIICSITGLAIIVTGAWQTGANGAELTSAAFETALPGAGAYIVTISLAIFAFTTIIGWSVYGERCVQYLFGVKSVLPFRILWVMAIYMGAVADLGYIWLLADTLNALMAIPNLIALLLLSPVIYTVTKEFMDSNGKTEEDTQYQSSPL